MTQGLPEASQARILAHPPKGCLAVKKNRRNERVPGPGSVRSAHGEAVVVDEHSFDSESSFFRAFGAELGEAHLTLVGRRLHRLPL